MVSISRFGSYFLDDVPAESPITDGSITGVTSESYTLKIFPTINDPPSHIIPVFSTSTSVSSRLTDKAGGAPEGGAEKAPEGAASGAATNKAASGASEGGGGAPDKASERGADKALIDLMSFSETFIFV